MHPKPPQRFHPTYGLVSGLRELQGEAPIIAPTTCSAAFGYNRWDLKPVIRRTTRLIEAPNERFANNLDTIDWLQQGRVVPHKTRRTLAADYAMRPGTLEQAAMYRALKPILRKASAQLGERRRRITCNLRGWQCHGSLVCH
jgi:hypothetical protein